MTETVPKAVDLSLCVRNLFELEIFFPSRSQDLKIGSGKISPTRSAHDISSLDPKSEISSEKPRPQTLESCIFTCSCCRPILTDQGSNTANYCVLDMAFVNSAVPLLRFSPRNRSRPTMCATSPENAASKADVTKDPATDDTPPPPRIKDYTPEEIEKIRKKRSLMFMNRKVSCCDCEPRMKSSGFLDEQSLLC